MLTPDLALEPGGPPPSTAWRPCSRSSLITEHSEGCGHLEADTRLGRCRDGHEWINVGYLATRGVQLDARYERDVAAEPAADRVLVVNFDGMRITYGCAGAAF